jgi:alpha-1,2-mannosyltransferase
VLVLRPFTLAPEGALRIVWLVLVCAAVAAIAAAVARGRRGAVVAATACALLVSAPAQSNLRFGQVSVFIVLLALVDALGLTPARYRGVLVGVAAAVKLTPLLFVVFFLVARRRDDFVRSVAAFVGGGLVGFAVLPSDTVRYWTSAVAATSRIGDLASLGNQSVRGMLLRVGVEQSVLPMLWLAIVAAICAVALLRARQLALAGDRTRAAVLVGCATVAASPVSWTHHQLWTVLAAMLLVAADGALRRIAGAALFVVMTLSLGVVLAPVSMKPGVQFALENARTLGAVAVCCLGFGGVAMAALSVRRRVWWRAVAAGAAGLALVALLPLPASATPRSRRTRRPTCQTRATSTPVRAGRRVRRWSPARRWGSASRTRRPRSGSTAWWTRRSPGWSTARRPAAHRGSSPSWSGSPASAVSRSAAPRSPTAA